MNIGKARAIFDNINDANPTLAEKGEAIREVLDMPTHNSVKRDTCLEVIDFLWNLVFEYNEVKGDKK